MENTEAVSPLYPVRWPYLLVGMTGMLFAGIIYAWSILKAPLAETFGWTASELALNFTLTMCFFCIGGIVSGILTRRFSPKAALMMGATLAFSGFMITSGMSGENIATLYLAYGGLGGLGIGIAYNAIIVSTNAWFPDKKGMCTGALMLGFGANTLLLGNLAGKMMDMNGVGWRGTYAALGSAIGVVLLAIGLILKFPAADTRFPQPEPGRRSGPEEDVTPLDYTSREMVRRFTFWRFFLFAITTCAVGSTVISFARDLIMSVGAAAAAATALVGLLSVCNGLGRIFCGLLFDALGRRRTMLAASAVTILAALVTLTAVLSGSLAVMIVGLCLTGISYGSSPTISAAFTAAFYGTRHYAMNFAIANTMLIPASFTATLAGSLVFSTGSFVVPCFILLASAVLSLILCLSIRHP